MGQRPEQTKARTVSHGCVPPSLSQMSPSEHSLQRHARYWMRTGFRGRARLTNAGLDEAAELQHSPTPPVLTRTVGPISSDRGTSLGARFTGLLFWGLLGGFTASLSWVTQAASLSCAL